MTKSPLMTASLAPGGLATLSGVSCASATACTAAGDYQTASLVQKTLAERYGP